MNTSKKTTGMEDMRVKLSTLWIFAMFNYLYADVFILFFNPEAQKTTLTMPEGAVLGFAILMETAIAMVLLSRVLKYRVNRWANILAGVLHTAAVAWSMIGETPAPYYIFFATIEIACTLFIVWYAWKWQNPEGNPDR
jgi:TRAP-type C4-dicarboxylate transport system permease small subunit